MRIDMDKLYDDVKANPGLCLIFVVVGFALGLAAQKFLFSNSPGEYDVVLKDSYIKKDEISRLYVQKGDFDTLSARAEKLESLNRSLSNENASLKINERGGAERVASEACRAYSVDLSSLGIQQRNVESNIEDALSPYTGWVGDRRVKTQAELDAGQKLADQLRMQANNLNNQILQLRNSMANCAKR